MTSAAQRWRDDLASWAIPDEILAAAPESPWILPAPMFTVPSAGVPDSPSHARAREALPDSGSVLDVGCGGGRAAMALVPPAAQVIGVDERASMLELFATAAREREVAHQVVEGRWPDAAPGTPVADVVVCHHVVYNVADLPPFLHALTAHARRRVVVELPVHHPLTHMAPLWREFWGLERPTVPTAQDCLEVAREAGIDARLETWLEDPFESRTRLTPEEQARAMRIRLCLPAEREPEVARFLEAHRGEGPRETATLWWDVDAAPDEAVS